MCGIAGIASFGKIHLDKRLLADQLECLQHRGPDGSGVFFDQNCMIGMRRLAIVDVKEGQQPSFSDSSNTVVVFNGEIYNYQHLAKSINFESRQPITEARVIAELFERYDTKCFEMLDGFFAIAIWDRKLNRLILARDRIGKKPLFYGINDSVMFFASEVKAILKAGFPASVNKLAVYDVLKYGYPREVKSAYENISQVAPGSGVEFRNGITREFVFWSLDQLNYDHFDNFEHAKDCVKNLLLESVEKRLISERPVGVFLSGGIDSSLVAAAVRELGRNDIESYSVGFVEEKYDESNHARNVSKHLGLKFNHIKVIPDPEFFIKVYPKVMDYPFADSSFLPTFMLSQFAARNIKVALSGDGGDESFGGYNRYQINLKLEKLSRLKFGKLLPNVVLRNRLHNKLYRAMKISDFESRYDSMMRLFEDRIIAKVINPSFLATSPDLEVYKNGFESDSESSALLSMQLDDLRNYLPGDLLVKMDMASMANGLEVRSPFLDPKMIKVGLSLPVNYKVHNGSGKYILREVLAEFLPRSLFDRPKQGFAIPRAEWLRGPLRDSTRDILLSKKCKEREWFSVRATEKILKRHDHGWNLDELIWPMLMIELWAINWLDS